MLLQVLTSSSSASVQDLQSAVEDSVSQLEQQGLLSAEALGQIFSSVSDMLNTETGQDQMDARTKVTFTFTQLSHSATVRRCWSVLPCLSAQRTNVNQNDHSAARLPQQHHTGSASVSQSCGGTHATPGRAHSCCSSTVQYIEMFKTDFYEPT